MREFAYHRPTTIAGAVRALRTAPDGKLLAGGMTLLPAMKNGLIAPGDLIDLAGAQGLRAIRRDRNDLAIGAMTTHAEVAASPDVGDAIPGLAALAGGIGDPAVRHRGTIGGSVANADPAADYPAAVLALDATIVTDRRSLPADGFFLGFFETSLEPDEIVTSVVFKIPDRTHYLKFRHTASGYAVVGVMVARFGEEVRVAVTGAGPCAFRVPAMEEALSRRFAPDAIEGIKITEDDLLGDMHFSAGYRAHLVALFARRAVAALGG